MTLSPKIWRTWLARAAVVVPAALAVGTAGCAADVARDLIAKRIATAAPSAIAGEHDIFIATTRARSSDRDQVFNGRRSDVTHYAEVDMTVPASHMIGAIERRRMEVADPARVFVAKSLTVFGGESAFQARLRADIARHRGRALVFIHGYNTAFDGAVYRMTQIVHDSRYAGTPVLFTWASGGRAIDYVYDSNSASAARDSLEQTLRLVAEAGATRIDIIAHSMGNWVTMEALRQLAISGDRDLGGRLGDVVLASPDIDVDVFKSQMARYGKPRKPFILFISGDDRALRISGLIAGNRPRVGDYSNAADLAKLGVVTVDLSKVRVEDELNHTKFAENPVLIRILGDRLQHGDDLETSEEALTDRFDELAGGLGGTVTSAVNIVVTTPFKVLNLAIGGR